MITIIIYDINYILAKNVTKKYIQSAVIIRYICIQRHMACSESNTDVKIEIINIILTF